MKDQKSKSGLALALLSATSLASVMNPTLSFARTPDAAVTEAATFGDIIVTARRTEERSQDVPVAITAFSNDMLQEQRITTNQDLQGRVPSLTVGASGQSRATETFTVRGQGATYNSAPGVVTYLAEVPVPAPTSVSIQGVPGMLLDLANVQILKGPQGTLFGRNTTGGAVLLEPQRPTDKYEGYLQGMLGNYDGMEFEGVVNLPISDKLKIRLTGRSVDRDGFTKDVVTGKDYDDRHYRTGRIGVTYSPTDTIENYVMVYGTRYTDHGTGFVLGDYNEAYYEGLFGSFGASCAAFGLGAGCSALTDAVNAQKARGPRDVIFGGDSFTRIKGGGITDIFSWDINPNMTLRNIASYARMQNYIANDQDGSPFPAYDTFPFKGAPVDDTSSWSEELQIQGTTPDNNLNYIFGAYSDRTRAVGEQGLGANVVFVSQVAGMRQITRSTEAVYGQMTYNLGGAIDALDRLKFTAGYRYTWDRAEGFGSSFLANESACANGEVLVTSILDCRRYSKARSSAPTWTLGLDYKVTDDMLLFAKVARGYKTGGINTGAVNPGRESFDPEFVTTYEAGLKSDFTVLDKSARFNIGYYHSKYKDIQRAAGDFNTTTNASGAIVINIAEATIDGIEVEASIEPIENLILSGNYSYTDASYDTYDFPILAPQIDCSGGLVFATAELSCLPFQYTPENQYSVSARYTLPLDPGLGAITGSVTYSYQDDQYSSPSTLPIQEPGALLESLGLLNLALTWENFLGRPIDLRAFMTNATNEVYRTSNSNIFNSIGVQTSIYGEPKMYGLSLKYHWGE